jgi:hypothetical protein
VDWLEWKEKSGVFRSSWSTFLWSEVLLLVLQSMFNDYWPSLSVPS